MVRTKAVAEDSSIVEQAVCQHVDSLVWCHFLCDSAEIPQKCPETLGALPICEPYPLNASWRGTMLIESKNMLNIMS